MIERFLPSERMILAKLSFLRTSDSTLKDEEKSYHFLHPTFQEFFAASYFVRQWISGKPLLCLVIGRNHDSILPHKFLQKEKYNACYDFFGVLLQAYYNLTKTKSLCYNSSECWMINHVIYLDLHISDSLCTVSMKCLQTPA